MPAKSLPFRNPSFRPIVARVIAWYSEPVASPAHGAKWAGGRADLSAGFDVIEVAAGRS
jgi:hypothetical protein